MPNVQLNIYICIYLHPRYASGTCFSTSFINIYIHLIVANEKKLTKKKKIRVLFRANARVPSVPDSAYKQYRWRDNGEKRISAFPSDVITLPAVLASPQIAPTGFIAFISQTSLQNTKDLSFFFTRMLRYLTCNVLR